jgi:hypothetical protein
MTALFSAEPVAYVLALDYWNRQRVSSNRSLRSGVLTAEG